MIRTLIAAIAFIAISHVAHVAHATTVKIEQYGDSTTQGWQVGGAIGYVTPMNAPAQLQAKLQNLFGTSVTVSNQGVGGTEATQLLNGTDGVHPAWSQQMSASTAQIVTLNFGPNDAYYSRVITANITPESTAAFKTALTSLVVGAKNAGKIVVLMEPNPLCEPIRQQSVVPYVQVIRDVSYEQSVAIVHHFDSIAMIQGWQGLLSDCLHPTDILYGMKASAEFDILAPMVKTLLGQ